MKWTTCEMINICTYELFVQISVSLCNSFSTKKGFQRQHRCNLVKCTKQWKPSGEFNLDYQTVIQCNAGNFVHNHVDSVCLEHYWCQSQYYFLAIHWICIICSLELSDPLSHKHSFNKVQIFYDNVWPDFTRFKLTASYIYHYTARRLFLSFLYIYIQKPWPRNIYYVDPNHLNDKIYLMNQICFKSWQQSSCIKILIYLT